MIGMIAQVAGIIAPTPQQGDKSGAGAEFAAAVDALTAAGTESEAPDLCLDGSPDEPAPVTNADPSAVLLGLSLAQNPVLPAAKAVDPPPAGEPAVAPGDVLPSAPPAAEPPVEAAEAMVLGPSLPAPVPAPRADVSSATPTPAVEDEDGHPARRPVEPPVATHMVPPAAPLPASIPIGAGPPAAVIEVPATPEPEASRPGLPVLKPEPMVVAEPTGQGTTPDVADTASPSPRTASDRKAASDTAPSVPRQESAAQANSLPTAMTVEVEAPRRTRPILESQPRIAERVIRAALADGDAPAVASAAAAPVRPEPAVRNPEGAQSALTTVPTTAPPEAGRGQSADPPKPDDPGAGDASAPAKPDPSPSPAAFDPTSTSGETGLAHREAPDRAAAPPSRVIQASAPAAADPTPPDPPDPTPVDDTVKVVLRPEELGRVTLTMAQDGDSLRVLVQADRPDTLELLRRNSDHLGAEFRQAGFAGASLSFGQRDGQPQQQQDRPPPGAASALSGAEPSLPQPARRSGLDIRI